MALESAANLKSGVKADPLPTKKPGSSLSEGLGQEIPRLGLMRRVPCNGYSEAPGMAKACGHARDEGTWATTRRRDSSLMRLPV